MTHLPLRFVVSILVVLFMVSCVPSKKYNDLLARKTDLEKEFKTYKKDYAVSAEKTKKLNQEIDGLNEKIEALQQDTSEIYHRYRKVKSAGDELARRLNMMLQQQENTTNTAISERKILADQLTSKEKQLDEKERALVAAQTRLKAAQDELNKSKGDVVASQSAITNAQTELGKAQKALTDKEKSIASLEADLKSREKRVNELEAAIKAQDDKSKALKAKINEALLGFAETDLTVQQRNGKVYVSLSQDLLFASGSTAVDRKGKDALKKLANVLIFNTDISINVEGHTDNVPFNGRAGMRDNWDLSVLRSTSLVRELIKNGVTAQRITASGKGEFFPVADNDSKDGRAKNRRSDIILSPKLNELYEMIQN